MDQNTTAILNSLKKLLGNDYDLLSEETVIMERQNPGVNPYDAVGLAIRRLVAQKSIPSTLGDRLTLGLQTAKTSGNNQALVNAIDASNLTNILRDTPVRFDTNDMPKPISTDPGAIATDIRAKLFTDPAVPTIPKPISTDSGELLPTNTTAADQPAVSEDSTETADGTVVADDIAQDGTVQDGTTEDDNV